MKEAKMRSIPRIIRHYELLWKQEKEVGPTLTAKYQHISLKTLQEKPIQRIKIVSKIELSPIKPSFKPEVQRIIRVKKSPITSRLQEAERKEIEKKPSTLRKIDIKPYQTRKSSPLPKNWADRILNKSTQKGKVSLLKISEIKKTKPQPSPKTTCLPKLPPRIVLINALKDKTPPKSLPSNETLIQTEGAKASGVSAGVKVNFYELFLELEEGEGSLRIALEPDGPAILVLAMEEGEEYGQAVQVICREILREKGKLDEVGTPVISGKEIEEELFPERLSSKAWLIQGIESKTEKLIKLGKSLLQSGSPGYLIFEVDQNKAREFYEGLKEEFRPYRNLYLLKLKKLSSEAKEKIASLSWGLGEQCDLLGYITSQGVTPRSFNDFFLWAEQRFWAYIEEISGYRNGLYKAVTKPNPEGRESKPHYIYKMFQVYHHATKRGLNIREQIEMKIKTEDGSVLLGLRPDIYLMDEKTAEEIETLYESGFLPLNSIQFDKLLKYREKGQSVRFILPNLAFLRHLEDMKDLKKHYQDMAFDFYTIDLFGNRLLAIEEVEAALRGLTG